MSIAAVGPGCGSGFLGCIRNGMPASSKRASNFAASRGAYLPSGTNSVCSGSSDFMRGWDTSNQIDIFRSELHIGNFRQNAKPSSAHEQAEVARSGSRSDPAEALQHPHGTGLRRLGPALHFISWQALRLGEI